MGWDQTPRAPLANALARYYDSQLDFRDAAAVLLTVAPDDTPMLAVIQHVAQRLSIVRDLEIEVHGELRAAYFEARAEYEREGSAA